jgi:hypothetical protein
VKFNPPSKKVKLSSTATTFSAPIDLTLDNPMDDVSLDLEDPIVLDDEGSDVDISRREKRLSLKESEMDVKDREMRHQEKVLKMKVFEDMVTAGKSSAEIQTYMDLLGSI